MVVTECEDDNPTTTSKKKLQITEDEDYGYNFYPHRGHVESTSVDSFWTTVFSGGRDNIKNVRCQSNAIWCTQNS